MRSTFKIWSALFLLSVALIVLGQEIGDRLGLLLGCLISLGINLFVYYYGYLKLTQIFGGQQLEGQDPWGMLERLRRLAERAKIPPPQLVIVPIETPTSFSAGRNWNHSSILLSEALIEELSPDEVEAVLAYEMARLKRHDTAVLGSASAFARGILWLPDLIEKHLPRMHGPREFMLAIHFLLILLLGPLAALALQAAVRTRDYYAADHQAAQMIANPDLLAQVLWKLNSYAQTRPLSDHGRPAHLLSHAHLFIVSPLANHGWRQLFRRQPPVERRIEKLVGHFPI